MAEPKDKQPDPLTRSAYADGMASRWMLADALMGGSEAMRVMGPDLLPQHINESAGDYADRIERSFLLPQFAQAVDNLADIVFSDPLDWDKEAAKPIEELLESVDTEGNTIEGYGKNVLRQGLSKGECYLIADDPPLPDVEEGKVVSLKDRREQGARPYLAIIAADNMLAFQVETRGGVQTPVYARWLETEDMQADDFTESTLQRVIEWRPGLWKKWERIGDGDWSETNGPLNIMRDGRHILPIVRFRLGKVDAGGRLSGPLQGLAEKNVEHWQSGSDQRAILTVSRFPMLAGSGVNQSELTGGKDGRLVVGPNATFFAKDPQSTFYYIETEGKAIEAGAKDLERLEKDMAQLAFQPLMRQAAGVTATKDALAESKSNCSLAAWALQLGEALDRAVEFLSLWRRESKIPVTSFRPNTEFGIETIDQVKVTALQAMRAAGDLSRPQFLAQMKEERVLSEDFDVEANEAELAAEGPSMAGLEEDGEIPDDVQPPDDRQPKPPVAA